MSIYALDGVPLSNEEYLFLMSYRRPAIPQSTLPLPASYPSSTFVNFGFSQFSYSNSAAVLPSFCPPQFSQFSLSPISRFISDIRHSSTTFPVLKCLQLNMRRSAASQDNLLHVIHELTSAPGDSFIALLQEPHTFLNRVTAIPPSLQALYVDSSRPRSVILLPRSCNSTFLPRYSSPDVSTVRLHSPTSSQDTVFCSVYWHRKLALPSILPLLCSYTNSHDLSLVIGADSNAHHPLWGCTTSDPRGNSLMSFAIDNNLTFLNDGSHTRRDWRSSSAIDVTLVNKKAANTISNWQVSTSATLSDHSLISFEKALPSGTVQHGRRSTIRKGRIPDSFIDHLEDELHPIRRFLESPCCTTSDLNDKADLLSRAIHRADTASSTTNFLSFRADNKKIAAPWWSKRLKEARLQARRAEKRYARTGSLTDMACQKKSYTRYKNMCRSAKTNGWNNFCSSFSGNPSKLLKKLSSNRRIPDCIQNPCNTLSPSSSPLSTLLNLSSSSTYSSTPSSTAMHLPSSSVSPSPISPSPSTLDPEALSFARETCKLININLAVKTLKLNRAPGPDKVNNNIIKSAWKLLESPLHNIFTYSIALGHVPDCWQEATGIFLPKPGKSDYTAINSWRTLNLTSSFLKLLEKVIHQHLHSSANIDETLDDTQLGFRKGRSCDEALHRVVNKIEATLLKGEFALGCFVDIKAAFDNVTFDSVIAALSNSGINPILVKWIYSLLSRRKVIFHLKGVALIRYIIKGTPQGGILSPLLWNLVVNSLLTSLKSFLHPDDMSQGFADDIMTLAVGKDPNALVLRQQRILDHINTWCSQNGLELSPSKTTLVLFTLNRKFTIQDQISINNTTVPFSDNAKYLGILLNKKLNWSTHLNISCNKAKASLATAKRLVGKKWGLSPDRSRYILESIVKPGVLYGAHLWAAGMSSSQSIKLKRVQNIALRTTIHCPRYTSSSSMCLSSASSPITIDAKHQGLKTLMRLKLAGKLIPEPINPRCLKFPRHQSLLSTFHPSSLPVTSYDIIPTCTFSAPLFSVTLTSPVEQQNMVNSFSSTTVESDLSIFSDGSKMGDKVGAGYVIYRKDGSTMHSCCWSLNPDASVFQAELTAIDRACSHILDNQEFLALTPGTISIYSDAKSAILAVSSRSSNSALVSKTRASIDSITVNCNSVRLCWIKGHIGIIGNEAADNLAKAGTSSAVRVDTPLPTSKLLQRLSVAKEEDLIAHMLAHGGLAGTLSHLTLPSYSSFLRKLPRPQLRKITAFLDNRAPLLHFLHKIGLSSSPTCTTCFAADETNVHLLYNCPALASLRMQHLHHFYLTPDDIATIHPSNLISFILHIPQLSD